MSNQLDERLQTELDRINVEEQRDDRPYFDISFIKNYPGLFSLMWILFVLTMALLLYSDSFGTIEYVVCILIFAVCNFSSSSMSIRRTKRRISIKVPGRIVTPVTGIWKSMSGTLLSMNCWTAPF